MRLSRKKAIALCIELWKWLAKTGKEKEDWPEWGKYGYIGNDCWFCEYGYQQEERYQNSCKSCCYYCPLWKMFKPDGCYDHNCYYRRWCNAKTPRTHKKYAKLFLAQIKEIK